MATQDQHSDPLSGLCWKEEWRIARVLQRIVVPILLIVPLAAQSTLPQMKQVHGTYVGTGRYTTRFSTLAVDSAGFAYVGGVDVGILASPPIGVIICIPQDFL